MKFQCGCDLEQKKNYRMVEISGPNNTSFLSSRVFDRDGNELCPEHNLPLVNYRTPLVQTPNGVKLDHKAAYPVGKKLKIKSKVEDRRDNRDPVLVGQQVLAQRRIERNGHGNGR